MMMGLLVVMVTMTVALLPVWCDTSIGTPIHSVGDHSDCFFPEFATTVIKRLPVG